VGLLWQKRGRDGGKKKIGRVSEKRKRGKVKRAKDGEVNGQGREKEGKGAPAPYGAGPASR